MLGPGGLLTLARRGFCLNRLWQRNRHLEAWFGLRTAGPAQALPCEQSSVPATGKRAVAEQASKVELRNHLEKKVLRSLPDARVNFAWVSAKSGAKSDQDDLQTTRVAKTTRDANWGALRRLGAEYLKSVLTEEQLVTSGDGKRHIATCQFFNTKAEEEKTSKSLRKMEGSKSPATSFAL